MVNARALCFRDHSAPLVAVNGVGVELCHLSGQVGRWNSGVDPPQTVTSTNCVIAIVEIQRALEVEGMSICLGREDSHAWKEGQFFENFVSVSVQHDQKVRTVRGELYFQVFVVVIGEEDSYYLK